MNFILLHFVFFALIGFSDPYSVEKGDTACAYCPTVLHIDRKDPPLEFGGSMGRPQSQH